MAGAYIVFNLQPGKTYSEKIQVANTTNSPMNVSLYPGAATNVKNIFQPLDAAHPNLLTSWTTVTPSSATIAAHSDLKATVTITVPANAPSGEQYGLIWASIKTSPNSNGVGGVSRVGIRMYDPVGSGSDSTPEIGSSSAGNSALPLELAGAGVLLLAALIVGILMVRKERKRAKKRRRKRRD